MDYLIVIKTLSLIKILMSFRKEQKYKLTYSDQKILKKIFFKRGMKLLYPQRSINSIYFDTSNLDFFSNSEEGVLPRKKIRVRWYDDNLKEIFKEIKISSIEGRFKINEVFKNKEKLFDSNFQIIDNEFGILKPKTMITYNREYFVLDNLRLTFDYNISYKDLVSLTQFNVKDKECVLEIKANFGIYDDYIEKIIGLPTSRFSKYCRSIIHTQHRIH